MRSVQDGSPAGETGTVLAGIACALFANFLFATSDAIVKSLTVRYSIFQIIPMQALVAMIPIAAMIMRDGGPGAMAVHDLRLVAARGFLAGIGTIFGFYAFSQLPLADVYAIAFCTPILVTVLSIPLLGENVGRYRWGAVIVGFLGVLMMIRPGFATLGLGHLAALGSVVTGALVVLLIRRIGRREQRGVMVLAVMVGLLVTTLPVLPFVARAMPWPDLLRILACGLTMGSAQFFVIAGLRLAPASAIAPMQYSMMIWALSYGALFFGDRIELLVVAGALVVVGASLFIMHRERQRGRTLRVHLDRS